MGIIVKFVLKNMWEKKFRTFLIIFSVMISAALFFATTSLSGTMEKMYIKRFQGYFGTADIMIQEGKESPAPRFRPQKINPYQEEMEYIVGIVHGTAFYKDNNNEITRISLMGVDWDEYQLANPITLYNDKSLYPFSGRKIVISKDTADKYGLKVGDNIELDISNGRKRFNVCAIAHLSGPFMDESKGIYGIVPRESLSNIYNDTGKVSVLLMKLRNPEQKQKIIEELAQVFKLYSVTEPISKEGFNNQVKPMAIAFTIISVIVFFTSIFIIYTSFKVITTERLPIIGTFRSIGATKRMTNLVLIAESLTYGILGGVLGGALGIGLLYIIMVFSTPQALKGTNSTLDFSPLRLVLAIVMAITLSFLSSIIPVTNASKRPIKDIIFNNMPTFDNKKQWKLILVVIFTAIVIWVPPLVPKAVAMVTNVICLVLSVAAIILGIPFITSGFTRLFERIYQYIFGNEGILAVQNLRDNKSVLNNITLLAIGVSSILLINTVSYSVVGKLTDHYGDMKYDIYLDMPQTNRNTEQQLKTIDGITDTYGVYEAEDINVVGFNEPISAIEGIDKNRHLEFYKLEIVDGNEDMLKQLDEGRNIILNRTLGYKYKKDIGDKIDLEMGKGKREYKVIGFINTLLERGNYGIIADRYLKIDMGEQFYGHILIKTANNPNEVAAELKRRYIDNKPGVESLDEERKKNIKSNQQMFLVLKGFSVLTILMGILGVFNNFIISFIERKRSLAVLRSIGMSKRQIIKMIFIESLTGGLIGGIIGVTGGVLMISIFPYVMKALDMPIATSYQPSMLLLSILTSVAITIFVSISPAIKSSRLNIIDAIKYE